MLVLRRKRIQPVARRVGREIRAALFFAPLLGCGSPIQAPPKERPLAPSAAESASLVASATLPGGVDLASVPPSLRGLFTSRGKQPFTRSEDGASAGLECSTLEPYWFEGRVRGLLECATDAKPYRIRYAATPEGLFLERDTWIPTLTSSPGTSVVKFDGGDNEENIPCTRSREVDAEGLQCATTECRPPKGQPATLERLCADANGIVSYETKGLGATRSFKLERGRR